jgi:hypothetical protein
MQNDYTTATRRPPDKENGCKDEDYAWTDKSPVAQAAEEITWAGAVRVTAPSAAAEQP